MKEWTERRLNEEGEGMKCRRLARKIQVKDGSHGRGERYFLVEGSGQLHRWMKIVVVPFRFILVMHQGGMFDLVGLRSLI